MVLKSLAFTKVGKIFYIFLQNIFSGEITGSNSQAGRTLGRGNTQIELGAKDKRRCVV